MNDLTKYRIDKKTLEVKHFQEGKNLREIGKEYNIDPRRIGELFRNFDIKVNTKPRRKYLCNEEYFTQWSENMAYILGFITCDGYIRSSSKNGYNLGIKLHTKDVEILKFILSEICPTSPIKYQNKVQHQRDACYCQICSKKIVETLAKFYIIPNKTSKEVFIEVPKPFAMDYLRGIIDGDGHISIKTYNYQSRKQTRILLSISSASFNFLQEINRFYFDNHAKIYKLLNKKSGNYHYSLQLTKRQILIKVLKQMYNGNFCLQRKYRKFLDILEYDDKHKKRIN